jgi:hypothetical protein
MVCFLLLEKTWRLETFEAVSATNYHSGTEYVAIKVPCNSDFPLTNLLALACHLSARHFSAIAFPFFPCAWKYNHPFDRRRLTLAGSLDKTPSVPSCNPWSITPCTPEGC